MAGSASPGARRARTVARLKGPVTALFGQIRQIPFPTAATRASNPSRCAVTALFGQIPFPTDPGRQNAAGLHTPLRGP